MTAKPRPQPAEPTVEAVAHGRSAAVATRAFSSPAIGNRALSRLFGGPGGRIARAPGVSEGLAVALQRAAGNRAAASVLSGPRRLARTPASAAVEPLLSYSAFDWEVTDADEAAVLGQLRGDPALSDTVRDLDAHGMLAALIERVDEPDNRRELMRLLGSRCDAAARRKTEPHVDQLPLDLQLIYHLAEAGVTTGAVPFTPTAAQTALIGGPSEPFSGVGATGVNPTTRDIPLGDQWDLLMGDRATVAKYSNPVVDLYAYLSGLTPTQHTSHAELFLRRPISSTRGTAYGGALPSRAQVITAAAKLHRLEPAMLAGSLLAEQRDQSANEDAKDYLAATSQLKQANTSIGLGQVVVSTAQRNDLFADLISSGTRSLLTGSHDRVADLLASDEFNIFAAARYLRKTADAGATKTAAMLPNTAAQWPGINFPAYANDSSTWPPDNIRALGSEYTSRAWDDVLVPAWGEFVYQAVLDCRASGAI